MNFNSLIRLSLQNRLLVVIMSLLLVAGGLQVLRDLPVDVLPELTRPTVTILTEAPGLAPEEVENLVTLPVEMALAGAPSVLRVRSSSGVGLSLVFAEFDWSTDPWRARQLVQERMQGVAGKLPEGVETTMGPMNSLLGEIMLVGITDTTGVMDPLDLRTLAEMEIGRRLQTLAGVSQVLAIGGGLKQLQVLPDPKRLAAYGITLHELAETVRQAQGNTGGGFLEGTNREFLIRNTGRSSDPRALEQAVIRTVNGVPVSVADVARVEVGARPKRGDAEVNGHPGVILGVQKQPGADTVPLTRMIEETLTGLESGLPPGVKVDVLFRQASFIQSAIHNVTDALRDGALMVALVLLLFLGSVRTTVITLTAIPLSFVITILCFKLLGVGINTMTLGGLAVAIGMVVDDAIVDVENVFRRLRQKAAVGSRGHEIEIIARASSEIRSSIFLATGVIILVFLPLLGLGGLEGRLFRPVAVATIVSMAASFLVALTVIPVLCSLLLPKAALKRAGREGFVVRWVHRGVRSGLGKVLDRPRASLFLCALVASVGLVQFPLMGREFLPPFNEGSAIVALISAPGTSLEQSSRLGHTAAGMLAEIPEIASIGRRVGRAEQDEHAEGVFFNEMDVEFTEEGRPRPEVLQEIRERLGQIPGTTLNLGQPISHRLDHMLTGVEAQLVIKVQGDDLDQLRRVAEDVRAIAATVTGVVDLQVEQQVPIPQIQIQVNRERAGMYGVRVQELNEQLELALAGSTVAQVYEGSALRDVVVRFPGEERQSLDNLKAMLVSTPRGSVPLELLADLQEGSGPNTINRENVRRRLVVSANISGKDLGSVVQNLEAEIDERLVLPPGVFLAWEGQFQNQQEASRRIMGLALVALVAMAALLYAHFRSHNLVLQILLGIPLAFAGGLLLTRIELGVVSIATLVGLITLAGVAARNTIMLLTHYQHLRHESGLPHGRELILRGTAERMVPVLMTAVTAGIALLPLYLAGGEPGKELLHPVAVVILGGLVSSTLLTAIVTPAVYYLFGGDTLRKR
jgi:CzcA family heavy metal efflux pump